nr:hemagglutinin [Quaranjavirus quaranfilense]
MWMLALLFPLLGFSTASPCTSESCSGPYRISKYKMPTIDVSNHKTHVTTWKGPKEITGILGYRSRYTAYCYEGGVLDGNTGCTKWHVMHPPSTAELQKWAIDGKCYYGVECNKGGDCWGSWADRCHDDKVDINSATEKEYNGNNEEWRMFAHHTCISTWRCGFSKNSYPVHFTNVKKGRGDEDISYTLATYDRHGSILSLDKASVKIDQETTLSFELPQSLVSKSSTEIDCFFGNEQTPVCQLNEHFEEFNGQFVTFNEDYTATYGNYLLALNDKKAINGSIGAKKFANKAWVERQLGKAASLEDVRNILSIQMWSHQESGYNLVQLYKVVSEMMNTLTTVINSVGKLDDELIGRLIGVEGRSKWFNSELFHMCPCFQLGSFGDSNCASGYIFSEGRVKVDKDGSKCTSFGGSITPLYLFDNVSYKFAVLHTPPAQGVAQDWEGWSWLAAEKQRLIETMAFQDSVSGGSNVLSQLYNEALDSFNIWKWFERFSTLAAWGALIISILNMVKK